MIRRHPVLVAVLSFFTLGLYGLYWLHETTDELADEAGRRLNPAMDVLLTVLTFGLFGVWALYRNAKLTHELLEERGEDHSDRSLAVLGFAGMSYFVFGWAWLMSMVLLQEDYNRLVETSEPLTFDARVAQARAYQKVRARVAIEGAAIEDAIFEPAVEARTSGDAPVFRSNAPMPVVY